MLKCQYCNKECKNKNSLVQHEIRCKLNPNKIISGFEIHNNKIKSGERFIWNKGLTKETDERIQNIANTYKNNLKTGKIKHWATGLTKETDERVKLISEKLKNNPNGGGYREHSGYGKSGWYKNIFCNSTWELAYVIYCLDNNINIKRCNLYYEYLDENDNIHKYYPDFIINNEQIIEIKGFISNNWKLKEHVAISNNVKILYKNDMKIILDYVIGKYGKDFEKLYGVCNR